MIGNIPMIGNTNAEAPSSSLLNPGGTHEENRRQPMNEREGRGGGKYRRTGFFSVVSNVRSIDKLISTEVSLGKTRKTICDGMTKTSRCFRYGESTNNLPHQDVYHS